MKHPVNSQHLGTSQHSTVINRSKAVGAMYQIKNARKVDPKDPFVQLKKRGIESAK